MRNFKVISFTHKTTDISNIGRLHLDQEERKIRLSKLFDLGLNELMYLSTCNRIEFLIVDEAEYDFSRLESFFSLFNPEWNTQDIAWAIENSKLRTGIDAVNHLFRIASSLDSLVIGEREIITQVRKSYDECLEYGLTGDYLRLIVNKTIECAKEVYTHTNIAKNPVSVVSLAYRTLRELNLKNESRVLVVGAGETNTTMCKFLYKHGFKNFTVANRTLSKAIQLAEQINGEAIELSALTSHKKGFDLLVTCTGSSDPIFTQEVYDAVLLGEKDKKCIIDLAIPTDVHAEVISKNAVHYIEIDSLREISQANIAIREGEIKRCESIIQEKLEAFKSQIHERRIEIAMREVPKKVKEIKEKAVSEVFNKELAEMDIQSRETVEKMMAYLEKKYISVPMKMAKEILLKNS